MKDKTDFRLQTCYHCGNQGLMPIRHVHVHDYGGPVFDKTGAQIDHDLEEHFEWTLLSCPVCGKVTLTEDYDNEILDEYGVCIGTKILYPQSSVDYRGIPKNIKTAFESALKVKNIDAAICSLSLRRVLETICKDKGVTDGSLETKIQMMIDRGILPEMFNDACWIVRQIGNDAAHGDNRMFSPYQVDQTIEFMKNILNYLYSMPVKMQELRSAIEEEKKRKKQESNACDSTIEPPANT